MILNLEQISSVTLGAVEIEEAENGVRFHRFTKAQRELYQELHPSLASKTTATSGIQLRFRTNSSFLGIQGSILKGSSRYFYGFDLFVNGEKKESLENFSAVTGAAEIGTKYPCGDFEKRFELGEGEKEVKLFFPWSAAVAMKAVTLADGASIIPVKPEKIMLSLGDSITQGYDAGYPSNSYVSRLAHALDVEVYNQAIGGEVFFPELADTDEPFSPDIITVAYGTNDWSKTTRSVFDPNCEAFYGILSRRYPNAKIFAITPILRNTTGLVKEMGDFSYPAQRIREVAASLPNVQVIDAFDFVPADADLFSDRKLHPNDEGFRFYFEGLYRAIKALL